MDISNIKIYNMRKNHALLDPCKKIPSFYSFQVSIGQGKAQEGEKIKRNMTKHDQHDLLLPWRREKTHD